MKHALSCLFAAVLPAILAAQTWGPGTRWTYYQFEFFEDPHTTIIQIVGDTMVNGFPAFLLSGSCYCTDYSSQILHKAGPKVYFYEDGVFYLLYDFSLDAGDTLEIFSPQFNCMGQPIRFPIDSVSYFQTLDGQLLKVQHLGFLEENCAYYFGNTIIENIGSDLCLFPGIGVCDPLTGPLICFETQAGVYYPVPGEQCISETTTGPGNSDPAIRLYPTVVTDHFNLESSGVEIRTIAIYQPDGRKVYEKNLAALSKTVNWPESMSGIYFVEIRLADGRSVVHKVLH